MRISDIEKTFAVLCDFDGTITVNEFGAMGLVFRKFANEELRALLLEKVYRREISSTEMYIKCFETITAGKEEMERFLSTVAIDEGLGQLIGLCQHRANPFAIVSDGLVWYIRYILDDKGFSEVPIFANDIEFTSHGFEFHFPWQAKNAPLQGISKRNIVRKYQDEGYFVVFVGDGDSDLDAAEVADLTYAKGRLLDYCRESGIAAVSYSTLADIV